jgi:hypothetical protein
MQLAPSIYYFFHILKCRAQHPVLE